MHYKIKTETTLERKDFILYEPNSLPIQNYDYLVLSNRVPKVKKSIAIFSFVSISGLLPKPNKKAKSRIYLSLGYAITPILLCKSSLAQTEKNLDSIVNSSINSSLVRCLSVQGFDPILQHPTTTRWYRASLKWKTKEYKDIHEDTHQALEQRIYNIIQAIPSYCTKYRFICRHADNLHSVSHILYLFHSFILFKHFKLLEIIPSRFKVNFTIEEKVKKIEFKVTLKQNPTQIKTLSFIPSVDTYLPDISLIEIIQNIPQKDLKKNKKEIWNYKKMYFKHNSIFKKRGYNLIDLDLEKPEIHKQTEQLYIQKRLPQLLLAQSFWIGYCLGKLSIETDFIPLFDDNPNSWRYKRLKQDWWKKSKIVFSNPFF